MVRTDAAISSGVAVTRIGVAIDIPQPWGEQLTRRRAQAGDQQAGCVPAHLTLLGPTDIDARALPMLERHLAAVAAAHLPFALRLRGTGTFRPVSPVVFVQVAEGLVECELIERAVRSGVLDRQLSFYYHPHVTVAHHLPEPALDKAFDTLADYQATFPVESFELYEHGSDGVWRPEVTFEFEDGSVW